MMWVLAVCMLLVGLVADVHSHGKLQSPPGRSSCWRFGFAGCVNNYNDNELFCGGKGRQWNQNGGKCGMCGDAWDLAQPRPNEAGGKYGKGVIVATYNAGQLIEIGVNLTAAHLGYFEFRLCKNDDVNKIITHECLNQNLLQLSDGTTRYQVPPAGTGLHTPKARLPAGLTCSQCVLQWKYRTGNSWDCEPNGGKCCTGCGPQEEFYGCADITIS